MQDQTAALSPRQRIAIVDYQIDQIRLGLQTFERVKPLDAGSWQSAWDKHPDLRALETELFRQRGILQQERDEQDHTTWQREQRSNRARRRNPAAA